MMRFFLQVLQFSAQQQAEFKSRALEYYEQKFGLTEVESNRNLHTMLFQTNPAVGAQTYLLEEEGEEPAQDAARLETYSGGWMVRIVNRNGKQSNRVRGTLRSKRARGNLNARVVLRRVSACGTPRSKRVWYSAE